MEKISTCLWFDNQAEEAVRFYTSIFRNSKTGKTSCYGDAGPGKKGDVITVTFELEGRNFIALNGGPQFKFNEAISLIINCEDQKEIDYYWDKLLDGGAPQMCGWLKDKFGVSWQVVPKDIEKLMTGDPERSNRVMAEVLKMVKLDLKTLQDAYDGK